MSTLLSALSTASNALDVMERAMGVIQNNVSNASTPGYVTQTLDLSATAFEPRNDLWGGVQAGSLEDSRSQFAESAVWNQNGLLGTATSQSSSLSALQSLFSVSGTTGIPAALSKLYSAFSAWSNAPTDQTSRQAVLTAATGVAQAFNQTAAGVQQLQSQTDQQLQGNVSQINQLSSQIAAINDQIRGGAVHDAGLNAQLYSTLEKLSNLTSINVEPQSDGTVTVLMNGQVPLVLGTTANQLQVTYLGSAGAVTPGAPPDAHIIASDGQDVTAIVNGGQLAALLQFRNVTLPSITGNGSQSGSLNQLAQAIGDRVNALLQGGNISSGPPAVSGVPLFTYAPVSPTSVASTFSVNPSITAPQLAAIQPGPPLVANGIADQLAQIPNAPSASDMVNGMSYTDFYSSVASGVGTQASAASSAQDAQTQLLTQAQNLRAQVSGVSLNDQAARLLQFQQSYEASARMISVINSTTDYLMSTVQNLA